MFMESWIRWVSLSMSWSCKRPEVFISKNSQEVSSFPVDDYKAAMNRRESMRNTRHKKHKWSTKEVPPWNPSGGTRIFIYTLARVNFFRFKILNFNIFFYFFYFFLGGGVRKMNIFGVWRFYGYFWGSSQNWTIFRGHFNVFKSLFLRSRYRMRDFWVAKISNILGVLEIPDIILGWTVYAGPESTFEE